MAVNVTLKDRNGNELNVGGKATTTELTINNFDDNYTYNDNYKSDVIFLNLERSISEQTTLVLDNVKPNCTIIGIFVMELYETESEIIVQNNIEVHNGEAAFNTEEYLWGSSGQIGIMFPKMFNFFVLKSSRIGELHTWNFEISHYGQL